MLGRPGLPCLPWKTAAGTEIAVAMAVPIKNPAYYEVRGVICFLPMRSKVILSKSQALMWNYSVAWQCMSAYFLADTSLAMWAIPLRHLRASSIQSGPGSVGLFPVSKKLRSTLLVNALQMMKTWRMLVEYPANQTCTAGTPGSADLRCSAT